MAFAIKDRVAETTVTTGTGTVTLLGAMLGFQSFGAIGNANTTCYLILSGNQIDWEMGIGTYTSSGTTLSRTTILSSSNSGSAISLVGSSLVVCAMPSNITGASGLFNQLFSSPGNGNYNLTVTGGVWTVTSATAGAAGGGLWNQLISSTAPTSANTGYSTWVNQGGAAVADNLTGISLSITTGNGSAHAIRGRSKAIPTAPYTETFLINLDAPSSFAGAGAGWYDGTKADTIFLQQDGLYHTTWTNTGSGSFSSFNSQIQAMNTKQIWLRFKDDNANNITAQYSFNGDFWVTVFTSTKTAGFLGASGYTNLLWFINNFSQQVGAVLHSYSHSSP